MKGRKGKAMGGMDEADEDLKTKPEERVKAKEEGEAEEKNAGGPVAKRKTGGPVAAKARKRGGRTELKVGGAAPMASAARKPRKSGGRSYSDSNPFTSASGPGKKPPGHSTEFVEEGG